MSIYRLLRFLLAIALGLCLAGGCRQAVKNPSSMKILFLGNSYTYVNDLPQLVADLAQSGNHKLEFEMVAEGGWQLTQHAQTSLTAIAQQKWDWVVLQEQSVVPAIETERTQLMYPAARILHNRIQANGSRTLLFMTWGRRDGLPERGLPNYEVMQAMVTRSYQDLADEMNVAIAPVGVAWQAARQQAAEINLWAEDGSHPTIQGSYLAACVFYAVLYKQSPLGLTYSPGLEKSVASTLQKIAADTVLSNRPLWHLP
jgi:Domain of unknown function (DUF4886)